YGLVTDGLHVSIRLEARESDRGTDGQGIAADHGGDLPGGRAVGVGGGKDDDAVRLREFAASADRCPGENPVARVAAARRDGVVADRHRERAHGAGEAGERPGRGRIDADVDRTSTR